MTGQNVVIDGGRTVLLARLMKFRSGTGSMTNIIEIGGKPVGGDAPCL